MTDRKPTGLSWESWTEKQIEEGRCAGLFDALDGAGKPIDGLDGTRDEDWWVKAKLRREEIDYLPPTLAIRADRDAAMAAALAASDEAEVRRVIEEINERIRYVNSHTVSGPPSTVWVIDVDEVLTKWRHERPPPPPPPRAETPEMARGSCAERNRSGLFRWWRRRGRAG